MPNYISEKLDDELYQKAMFTPALAGDNYLGNPEVVGRIIADFCVAVREVLVARADGAMDVQAGADRLHELRDQAAAIVSGNDPSFQPQAGWNDASLPARLKVELGPYWQAHRAKNDDDPVKTLFSWLIWATHDSVKRAAGDQDMEGVYLSEHTGQVIRLVLGTDRRAA